MKPNTLSAYKITPRHIMQLIAVMAFPASIFLFETVDRFRLEGSLYDSQSVNAVIIPSILGACLLKFAGNEPIARTFLAIGVPIGLIGSYFDVVVVVSSMDGSDFNFLGLVSAIMLLAVAYGALISALGYAFNTGNYSVIEPIKKRYLILFSLIVILSFVNNIQTITSKLLLESSSVYPLFFDPNKHMKQLHHVTDKSYIDHMIPHHMVAVDMSKILLKNTKNDLMIGFAYRIIKAQQSEIIMLDNLRKSLYKHSSNLV